MRQTPESADSMDMSGHGGRARSEALMRQRVKEMPFTLEQAQYSQQWEHEANAHLSRIHVPQPVAEVEQEAREQRERVASMKRYNARWEARRRIERMFHLPTFVGDGI